MERVPNDKPWKFQFSYWQLLVFVVCTSFLLWLAIAEPVVFLLAYVYLLLMTLGSAIIIVVIPYLVFQPMSSEMRVANKVRRSAILHLFLLLIWILVSFLPIFSYSLKLDSGRTSFWKSILLLPKFSRPYLLNSLAMYSDQTFPFLPASLR